MTARYIVADVYEGLASLPDNSVDCVVTSPPFLALRSYLPADHPDKAKELGSEPTPAAFIDALLDVVEALDRVLTPHGSICIELGDTYSGASAEGSDQKGSSRYPNGRGMADLGMFSDKKGDGWPLAKSLCLIPESFRWALVYGRNPFNGRETPQWRARNVVRWHRPNPPVGALGDKFRPATSEMVIACKSGKRYFDLDAVRNVNNAERMDELSMHNTKSVGSPQTHLTSAAGEGAWNPAGAPPLDTWIIPTEPYPGSHYATMPSALCVKPIKAMCPERVCRKCGEPSRRIVEKTQEYAEHQQRKQESAAALAVRSGGKTGGFRYIEEEKRVNRAVETLGWTDCGHGSIVCSSCAVVVPYDYALRRPRETQGSSAEIGDEDLLAEPVEGESSQAQHSRDMRDVQHRVSGQSGRQMLHAELFGEVGTPGGPSEQHQRSRTEFADMEGRTEGHEVGLRPGVGANGDARPSEARLHDGASATDAGAPRQTVGTVGVGSPPQRIEGGQPPEQPGDSDSRAADGDGPLPALRDDVSSSLVGYVCPCGSSAFRYVADHYRPGVVLDCFAGSGTTLSVATGHGRDAIGLDIDSRNADLAVDRIGPLLCTVETLTEGVA